MSRLHCSVFGLALAFALLAVCGLGVTSASAEVKFELTVVACEGGTQNGPGSIILCWENNENLETLLELKGEEEFTILSPIKVTLLASLEGESFEINCGLIDPYHLNSEDETELAGIILQWSPLVANYNVSGTYFLFLECKLLGALAAKKCSVPTERATVALDATPESETDLVFLPESGTTFIGIPIIKGSGCPTTLPAEPKVTGTQLCVWGQTSILVDQTEHLLECGKSSLKFAESNEAEFAVDLEVEPVNLNERWDITDIG
jgi:hypothetical protein